MDISYTNVLKGARQYFQGLPAAGPGASGGGGKILPPSSRTSASAASEHDGSVRSEQHSAVPVYWDQQNEGQAAANLTNREAPPPPPPPSSSSSSSSSAVATPAAMSQQQQGGGNSYTAAVNDAAPLYHSHISSAASSTSKTYYELQSQRAPASAPAPPTQTAQAPVAIRGDQGPGRLYYPSNPSAYYPPTNTSSGGASSQEAQYGYKMYSTSQPQRQQHHQQQQQQQQRTNPHYFPYPAPSLQPQPQAPRHPAPPPPPPPSPPAPHAAPTQGVLSRRHLPVQPSNMYHHSSRNVVDAAKLQNASKASASYKPPPPPPAPAPNTYPYYANGNYPVSNSYGASSSTVSYPPTAANYTLAPPSPAPATRTPAPKVRRESPLDLSVKTVRTSADSTLGDSDERHYRPERPAPQPHAAQYLAARAPKVDFLPNFEMQQEAPPPPPPPPPPPTRNNYYNYPYATSSSLPKVEFDFQQRKRSLEHAAPPAVPEKVPKVDTWRQKMDLQIEQRLSAYAKPRPEGPPGPPAPLVPNGGLPHYRAQPHAAPTPQARYAYFSSSSTVAPTDAGKQAAKEATSTRPQATKKVLNLLRTSLQNKGARAAPPPPPKKVPPDALAGRLACHAYVEREVLQPTTDVMAPLQPKPGIVGRRNVSPFTASSLERSSNTPPTYKFHLPKAIDSVIISDDGDKEQEASMGSDLDGLAAFLAARIRTKAELKQVSAQDAGATAPVNDDGGSAGSPPKLTKEQPGAAASPPATIVPKKLFGRSEMKRAEVRSSSETSVFDFPDSDNEADMPVLERQSLLNMRKDRRLTPNGRPCAALTADGDGGGGAGAGGDLQSTAAATAVVVVVVDAQDERPSSPFSLLFNQACDSFVEQLMGGTGKKRGRRKRGDAHLSDESTESDVLLPTTVEIKKEVLEEAVAVKREPVAEELAEKLHPSPPADRDATSSARPEGETPIAAAAQGKHTDTDSDTPLVHIATKQRKKFSKKDAKGRAERKSKSGKLGAGNAAAAAAAAAVVVVEVASSDSEVEKFSRVAPQKDFYASLKPPIAICKPGKKPTFGDGSDFRPGWEDALFRYKKSIRIPMQLIQVTRPPSSQRLSTSLPDLDPCPVSPAPKTESSSVLDSDMDSSNCSFSFAKHYDSDQGSMRSFSSKCSILDKLLVRVGAKKRRRCRKEDVAGPRTIPKSESELLPTPSLEMKEMLVKSTSALLGFRKKTVDSFKDAFANSASSEFSAVVLKARTRTETRVLKEKATIREVFGEDRPASAPPVTCVDELKPELEPPKGDKENQLKKEFGEVLLKAIESKKLEISVEGIKKEKAEEAEEYDDDGDDRGAAIGGDSVEAGGGRRRSKMRRKLSSGFDYIRKKKKHIRRDDAGEEALAKARRRGAPSKATPESVDDIQREIKQWVLNKGVGETHLHRASRCGYTDITAYCLEKMLCNPSPKDNAGYTPLHEACSRGHLDIARLLLQYGAQVSESAAGGIRPLHEAAENGYVEIIRLLLSYGADPALATYGGTTPLQLASDDTAIALLQAHLDELQGRSRVPWRFNGPAGVFDGSNDGFDPLADVPAADPLADVEEIEFEASEHLLPNLYVLPDCAPADRWVILQDLTNALKIKSKETLLRQLSIASPSKGDHLKEMKTAEFLEKARCCQFVHANEKLNTRLSKMSLVKYTDKVRRLLNVELVRLSGEVTAR